MRQTFVAVAMISGAVLVCGQEATVQRSAIWVDTVKSGDMPVSARGKGALTSNTTAELKIPESFQKQVATGQKVVLDTKVGLVNGSVVRTGPAGADGMETVWVKLDHDLPPGASTGDPVDGVITITTLKGVVFVGRPVKSDSDSEVSLFKIDPDGEHASRVSVQFGQESVNVVEVRSGLKPGDKVILSSMAAFAGADRLRLQ